MKSLLTSLALWVPLFAQATSLDPRQFLEFPTLRCGDAVGSLALIPSPGSQDAYNAQDTISTELLKDSLHINRLFYSLDELQWIQTHAGALLRLNFQSFGMSPRKMIEGRMEGLVQRLGFESIQSVYGSTFASTLHRGSDTAEFSLELAAKLASVLHHTVLLLHYQKTWRHFWVETTSRDFNTALSRWASEQSAIRGSSEIRLVLDEVTAQAEAALAKHASGAFRAGATPSAASDVDWNRLLKPKHLPSSALRALYYLRAQAEAVAFDSPLYRQLLSGLDTAMQGFDALASSALTPNAR